MQVLETALTRLIGTRLPIVQAGMSWASSCSALPLAVSRAGGLGVVAAGPMRPHDLVRAVDEVRAGTDQPWAVNLPLYRKSADEIMDLLVARRPSVLIASQGGPRRYLQRFRDAGTVCLHVVSSREHAEKAVDAGVDGLVVVGGEAGGHPPPDLVATHVMVRAVVRALPGVPVVASGGISDGAGLASVLAAGASGAQFGTRFLASDEATVHRAYKQAVVDATVDGTRTVGAGLGVIRGVANRFTEEMAELERSGADLEARRTFFLKSTLRDAAVHGDVERGKVEAGQSAGLVDEVLPASTIVQRLVEEYAAARAALPEVRER